MAQVQRKPAANAHKFLSKKWNDCLVACEKTLRNKNALKLRVENLERPTRWMFDEAVSVAREHWGTIEVDAALKELGFSSIKQDGMPYFHDGHISRGLSELRRKSEAKLNN